MFEEEFEVFNRRFHEYCARREAVRPFSGFRSYIFSNQSRFNQEISRLTVELSNIERDTTVLVAADILERQISGDAIASYQKGLAAQPGYSNVRASFIAGVSGMTGLFFGLFTSKISEDLGGWQMSLVGIFGILTLMFFIYKLNDELAKRAHVAACAQTFSNILDRSVVESRSSTI
ncbi:hypothetical protein [Thalassolituus alkanivorans]|uniref:hypothetical protein n=1 Tax=Thalassolituus alkanivorans TaxID=2881055 RepID=UPI001E39E8F4|nr:hypothetical protein [Thalassolituus alkanivorans]MCB2385867.1 hypothetical protein [Thalassolituus alkanivorans]MCB2421717.1 hypothetical protein [Thalassolituus alkanivorans]